MNKIYLAGAEVRGRIVHLAVIPLLKAEIIRPNVSLRSYRTFVRTRIWAAQRSYYCVTCRLTRQRVLTDCTTAFLADPAAGGEVVSFR
jgi:hypothetical protein